MNCNWGANTFIQYHKTFGVFFRWCIKEKFMENNPTNDIEIPKLPKRISPKLTKEEAMRIPEVAYNYSYKYKQRYYILQQQLKCIRVKSFNYDTEISF